MAWEECLQAGHTLLQWYTTICPCVLATCDASADRSTPLVGFGPSAEAPETDVIEEEEPKKDEHPKRRAQRRRETMRKRRQAMEKKMSSVPESSQSLSGASRPQISFEDKEAHEAQLADLKKRFKKISDDVELNLDAGDRSRLQHLFALLSQGQQKMEEAVDGLAKIEADATRYAREGQPDLQAKEKTPSPATRQRCQQRNFWRRVAPQLSHGEAPASAETELFASLGKKVLQFGEQLGELQPRQNWMWCTGGVFGVFLTVGSPNSTISAWSSSYKERLLQQNADANATNTQGATPLDFTKKDEVRWLLRSHKGRKGALRRGAGPTPQERDDLRRKNANLRMDIEERLMVTEEEKELQEELDEVLEKLQDIHSADPEGEDTAALAGSTVVEEDALSFPTLIPVLKALDQSVRHGSAAQEMAFMEFVQLTTSSAKLERKAKNLGQTISKLLEGQITGKPDAQEAEWQAACKDLILDMEQVFDQIKVVRAVIPRQQSAFEESNDKRAKTLR
ncbi:unnamed protein product [Cladocopium goreaui]|uniref:Uncharacterized protein n=1 Tax=Cladocopium goreaui TaxID=2562237 RepID=A0A9P1FXR3_9DINO|nr:unnamed protein product [Cladocopium goreaui]